MVNFVPNFQNPTIKIGTFKRSKKVPVGITGMTWFNNTDTPEKPPGAKKLGTINNWKPTA